MSTVRWVYPESLDDLRRHLADGVRLHAGGTGLMRNPPDSGTLADLSRAGIARCAVEDGVYRLGGCATIANAALTIAAREPEHIVVKALSRMAAPALRNRITLGGSIAFFPPWTSVIGPLLAARASVTLVGSREETVPLERYLDEREFRAGTAIVRVDVDALHAWKSYWFAFARTRFNYPLFSVAVVGRAEGEALSDLRVVVTGNAGRYRRLAELEARLAGARPPFEVTDDDLGTRFLPRQGFSEEYLSHLVRAGIERGLESVVGVTRE